MDLKSAAEDNENTLLSQTSLELRDLRWAIIAARHRSLRDLEHRLGVKLFERTNGGTRPTPAAHEFLTASQRIVQEVGDIVSHLQSKSRGDIGSLTVGIQASLSTGNLRASLIDYRKRFPNVEITLVDGSGDHLHSDLANSAIDVAFVIGENSYGEMRSRAVWSERVVAALPCDHPLSQQDIVKWNDLASESILIPKRGPGRELCGLLMKKSGCLDARQVQHHDVSLDRLLTLVGTGCGILLALEGATGATYPGVIFREMHDQQETTRLSFRVVWREANRNPALERFLSVLGERFPDLSPVTI